MTAEPRLPARLTSRPATEGDAEAVLAMVNAAEVSDQGETVTDLDDIRMSWARPSFDLERDTVLLFDGHAMVGGTEVSRGYIDGAVHPDNRGRGIGGFLL